MAIEQAMALTNRLLSHAQALAAVTTDVRLAADGYPADPALHARLDRIGGVLDARDALDTLTDDERQIVSVALRCSSAAAYA